MSECLGGEQSRLDMLYHHLRQLDGFYDERKDRSQAMLKKREHCTVLEEVDTSSLTPLEKANYENLLREKKRKSIAQAGGGKKLKKLPARLVPLASSVASALCIEDALESAAASHSALHAFQRAHSVAEHERGGGNAPDRPHWADIADRLSESQTEKVRSGVRLDREHREVQSSSREPRRHAATAATGRTLRDAVASADAAHTSARTWSPRVATSKCDASPKISTPHSQPAQNDTRATPDEPHGPPNAKRQKDGT